MSEIKNNDVPEIKNQETDKCKEIKPEGGITQKEAKNYWNDKFSANEVKTDDNGLEYREGDDLKPNTTYEINGYKYKTDDQGRVVSAEGKLQLKDHEGYKPINSRDTMDVVGKGDQKENDDRGHLIGDRFNGKGDLGNLVPMDKNLNRGDYASLEKTLADALGAGSDVRLKVEPIYSDSTRRPSEFKMTYTIDGEKDIVSFKNGGN